ncbi:FlgK family flagellar hook-associated protein [Roseivivax isoporae]|uniref:Flagellar hook-associated protein 1 n=1 Tax=Roseivivax isoporae LMG 25204 TaxID=1449351 RepID=X7FA49_9RHOB|nr:flagellar basal body rod C-terminal domain-containing protein [Roseivivax isoporae]ETX29680.1 flagellar hook protein FlgK [Roseivivax isoporae LMG 25204]
MGLSAALSNALSGLTASARSAALVSSNIANATTEGYGRRELSLAANGDATWGGVSVTGVVRHGDPVLLADRWLSDSGAGYARTMQAYADRLDFLSGSADDGMGTLGDRLAAFENALTVAAGNPASAQRLADVAQTAVDMADALNTLSAGIQEARSRADAAIAADVGLLNTNLGRVADLNDRIVYATRRGGDVSGLLDQRQAAIDGLSALLPVRLAPRGDGAVALYTGGGALLLDGNALEIGFSPTPYVAPHQTLAGGTLSGLTIAGNPVSTDPGGPLGRGSLAAQFRIRDVEAVAMQDTLDAVALDLAQRFGPGGPDTTLGAADPGLFTDAGAAVAATPPAGLAGRIAINPLVAPGSTEQWRLRDGLAAAAPGPVGDAGLLQDMGAALRAVRVPSGVALGTGAKSLVAHVADLSSAVSGFRVRADGDLGFAEAQNMALRELELAGGVDTDAEVQKLLQLEQSYAANARVLTAVDEMLERLLAI